MKPCEPAMDLFSYMNGRLTFVEKRLRQLLKDERGVPPRLMEAMCYSLLAPAKRLRPILVFMAVEASGGEEDQGWPAACAVEMIHTYSLIHDDLPAMDDDDLRRGLPSCHKKFGEALAILAGDALLTLAFQVLAEHYPPRTAAACCRELARGAGAAGMVGGQVEDMAWERGSHQAGDVRPETGGGKTEDGGRRTEDGGKTGPISLPSGLQSPASSLQPPASSLQPPASNLQALENIHARKTGALFRACLRLGVWAAQGELSAGPDTTMFNSLDNFGRCFGQVFQITDDLLDVEGTAADTGKRVQKDAARGKLTYPGLLGVAESRRRARLLAEEAEEHLRPLGNDGQRLLELLRYVLTRKR